MDKLAAAPDAASDAHTPSAPMLKITRLGIVSRNYETVYPNGYRDFSHTLTPALELLDQNGCDAVLFSLFSIIPRLSFETTASLKSLKTINSVFLEEFVEDPYSGERKPGRFLVYYRNKSDWAQYSLQQQFGSIVGRPTPIVTKFVSEELPKRMLGNACVLIGGETNGVKYSKRDSKVNDVFGLRAHIPDSADLIVNPVHDKITRQEMLRKRKFLSERKRWVVSVWNKGSRTKKGCIRDGNNPAWTVFYDGRAVVVETLPNTLGLEIGIVRLDNH